MSAPRAKFDRIYVVSPAKVAILFLTALHDLFLLIALLTSFWISTRRGHYGPLFKCERQLDLYSSLTPRIFIECHFGNSLDDINIIWMPVTAVLVLISFLSGFIVIIVGTLSLVRNSTILRRRYWLCTIVLLLFVSLIDCLVLILVPLANLHQTYRLQWAYGVHFGGTLFVCVSLITAILTHNSDDIEYIEAIDESSIAPA